VKKYYLVRSDHFCVDGFMVHIPLLSIFSTCYFCVNSSYYFLILYNQGGKKDENHFPQTEITNLIKTAMRRSANSHN